MAGRQVGFYKPSLCRCRACFPFKSVPLCGGGSILARL
ncbi:hypothetical protein CCACVL1_10409 [Corchorus capsularis]|uniref:Uncharacterized protein n=1 Tax=Corchorus capsularis TaxID=210143 RepID=A0A1R3IRB8_COCAP|nr:hypothetical protein CCACVL1_10409 [Corchorus capsularis]